MSDEPLSNGTPNRDANGRLLPGHKLPGPGNPNLASLNKHRAALLRSIKTADVKASLAVQVELFRDKTVTPSVRLAASIAFQNRVLGLPADCQTEMRLESLEKIACVKVLKGVSMDDL